jgi:ankyrin repeat protein
MNVMKVASRLPWSKEHAQLEGDNLNIQEPSWDTEHGSETRHIILEARKRTTNPEVYNYLTRILRPGPITPTLDEYADLRSQARWGNMTMVLHLLDLGVPVQMTGAAFATPLILACSGLHHDIVDLLLERGADPNFRAGITHFRSALHQSPIIGSLSLVRKLLGHGAAVNRPPRYSGRYPRSSALFWAFAREHTDMIRFLKEQGAFFNGRRMGSDVAEMLYRFGYDSMADILRKEYGLQFIGLLFPLPRNRKGWTAWAEARRMYIHRCPVRTI